MKNEEKRTNENKFAQKCCDTSCCTQEHTSEMMSKCCEDMSESNGCGSMMAECMKKFRWFPLIPVIIGILLLLLGYYLDAEITRILWMIAAGFVILAGTFGLIMMGRMKKICC